MNMQGKEIFLETNKKVYNASELPSETVVIPVIEETVNIAKEQVETGRVRIEKKVEEINEAVAVSLLHDEYTILRVAVNKYIDEEAPQVRYEGNTMVIPVVKEVMVKKLLLIEEVWITKEIVPVIEQLNIPLRKETVIVNRTAADSTL